MKRSERKKEKRSKKKSKKKRKRKRMKGQQCTWKHLGEHLEGLVDGQTHNLLLIIK